MHLLTQDCAHEALVVHVAITANERWEPSEPLVKLRERMEHLRADLHALQELINLIVGHLLAQLREHVAEFTCTDDTISILVKDLESADELL